ncbi:MAG: leucine-rich repeat domain-containing protein [Bacteroidota bacterium]
MKKISILFLGLCMFASCGKDDDNNDNADNVKKSDAKAITAFVFTTADNEALTEDIKAEINEDDKTIVLELPSVVNLAALKPTITISEKATVNPKEKVSTDFSSAVTYTVTAEDDTKVEYSATITRALTEREALTALYNANPDNELGWDLEETDIATWRGVTLNDDGKLVKLDLELDSLPTAIRYLTNLRELDLSFSSLTSLPPEIGNLTNLGKLLLSLNSLTSLPPEIGNLTNLEELALNQNSLTSVPPEISKLTNLVDLRLWGNSLVSVPAEIGNLTNLEELRLDSNSLTSLPSDIGKLTKLKLLWIGGNEITSIPKEICDLNTPNFQTDATAECEQ